jgi:hypothetical protein
MRVGVVRRGKYGDRLIDTIKKHTDFEVVSASIPEDLPSFIEDPESFMQEVGLDMSVFKSDMMILYTLHPDVTPEVVRMAGSRGVKAVVIPGGMSKAGTLSELREISRKYGIFIEVDEICCTLQESGIPALDEFSRRLGRPELKIISEDGIVKDVEVVRGSPCGGTWHSAAGLVGKTVGEVPSLAGLLCQQYPCRAVRGTPGGIHTSGDLHKDAAERALGLKCDLKIPPQSRSIRIRGGEIEAV